GARVSGKDGARRQTVEVRLTVAPASSPIEEARSKGRVGSQAPGCYSSSLTAWAFERPDGLVVVPDQGECSIWRGITLRAFAWSDLFVGNAPVRCTNERAYEKLSIEGHIANKAAAAG